MIPQQEVWVTDLLILKDLAKETVERFGKRINYFRHAVVRHGFEKAILQTLVKIRKQQKDFANLFSILKETLLIMAEEYNPNQISDAAIPSAADAVSMQNISPSCISYRRYLPKMTLHTLFHGSTGRDLTLEKERLETYLARHEKIIADLQEKQDVCVTKFVAAEAVRTMDVQMKPSGHSVLLASLVQNDKQTYPDEDESSTSVAASGVNRVTDEIVVVKEDVVCAEGIAAHLGITSEGGVAAEVGVACEDVAVNVAQEEGLTPAAGPCEVLMVDMANKTKKYSELCHDLEETERDFLKSYEKELELSTLMKQASSAVYLDIYDRINENLKESLKIIKAVIEMSFSPDSQKKILREIEVIKTEEIALSLMKQSSKKYVYADIEACVKEHGFMARIPTPMHTVAREDTPKLPCQMYNISHLGNYKGPDVRSRRESISKSQRESSMSRTQSWLGALMRSRKQDSWTKFGAQLEVKEQKTSSSEGFAEFTRALHNSKANHKVTYFTFDKKDFRVKSRIGRKGFLSVSPGTSITCHTQCDKSNVFLASVNRRFFGRKFGLFNKSKCQTASLMF